MTKSLPILNFVLRALGSHAGGWRRSPSDLSEVVTLDYYARIAQTAERGRFDSLFITDGLAVSKDPAEALQWPLDPVAVITALAGKTAHIALIATHSTTFNAPYSTARTFQSIDNLTGGRAGWNVVTTSRDDAAQNYGQETILEHDLRYERAGEYLDAVFELWRSWLPGAVVGDKQRGIQVDPDKIYHPHFEGDFWKVRGPVNGPAGPQVYPIIAQAGASGPGRDLGAKYADFIYVFHDGLDSAKAYRDDIRRRATGFGRNPDEVKVLPGIVPYVRSTRAGARALLDELFELDSIDAQLAAFGTAVGIPFESGELGRAVPWQAIIDNRAQWQRERLLQTVVNDYSAQDLTLKELLRRVDLRFQHKSLVGTPEDVADYIIEGYTGGAFDGVSVIPPVLVSELEEFVDTVIPVLQRRGFAKTEYAAGPARQRLGLRRPPHTVGERWTPLSAD